MPNHESSGAAQGRRIREYCKTIYGDDCDYDIELETDDHIQFYAYVRKDLGLSFGHMLTDSGVCGSEDRAFDELERILAIESKHALSGVPMTREELVRCYGVKTGEALYKVDVLWRDEKTRPKQRT